MLLQTGILLLGVLGLSQKALVVGGFDDLGDV